uniref:Uncharacterized protein n=1 Tax=Lygus hesperus TaxID=30085 RepID=A0A0A9Y1L5_LYGHE
MLNDTVKELKERSQKRKKLLVQTFGVSNLNELRQALGTFENEPAKKKTKVAAPLVTEEKEKEEEKTDCGVVYKDSSTFLKGTQSSNPHNDYCQHFVDTGQRPQNFIRDVGLADRFEEYPKLRELIKLKKGHYYRKRSVVDSVDLSTTTKKWKMSHEELMNNDSSSAMSYYFS